VHAHGRFLYAGALALEIKKKNKIRYIYTEHSTYFQRSLVPSDAIPVCREIIKEANVYTVVSKALLSHVETLLQSKYPQAKIVPNALDLIFEQPLNKRPERKEFNFTVIASLDHKKGIDLLLKAFNNLIKNYPQLRLNICGEGPMKKDIEKFIEDHHLKDRVLLLGKKSKEEVLELLDIHTDVFVLPSREETFGVVVIEAISRGIPVIATRSGGPEFIINKDCGFLIEPGDPEIIYSAMNDMLTKYIWFDKNQIRKYAIDAFGSKTFLLTMDKIYSEIKDDRNN
jgi:glycosyltransferase involved in cell wall biosynthesis